VIIVDKPGAPQTQVAVAQLAVPRSDPDFDKVSLLNTVLGGAYGSRLNMNLRERHGYTYGAYSMLIETRGVGRLSAGGAIRTDATGAAVSELLKEIEGMRSRPVTDEELARAKGFRIQGLPGRFETSGSVAEQIASLFTFDLPENYYGTLPARLGGITAQDIAEVAKKYLVPERALIVAVGDRAKIEPQLRPMNLGEISLRDADGKQVAPAN
jgi:zinc protease